MSAKTQKTKLCVVVAILKSVPNKDKKKQSSYQSSFPVKVLRSDSECSSLPTEAIVHKHKSQLAKNLETWFLSQFCPGGSLSLSLSRSQVPHLKNEEVKLCILHRPFQPQNPRTSLTAFCSPSYKTSDYLLKTVNCIILRATTEDTTENLFHRDL